MTREKADAELDELGLEMIERTILRAGKEVREYAVVRKGPWPANTPWFAPASDMWHHLRWLPTWQFAYTDVTGRTAF